MRKLLLGTLLAVAERMLILAGMVVTLVLPSPRDLAAAGRQAVDTAQNPTAGPVVRQGHESVTRYASPMIVSFTLPGGSGEGMTIAPGGDELRKNVCEGISIDNVEGQVIRTPAGKRMRAEVIAQVTFKDEIGHDKAVDVVGELLYRDAVIGTTQMKEIEVEEGKKAVRWLKWRFKDAHDLPFDPREMTVRLTLTVRED
jgi:hypothetical protein